MKIALHQLACTTPAVRAEIAASKESVSALARRFGVTPPTIYKWRSRQDFFNTMNEQSWIQPIMLLGEATFHQFHGGVATNVPRSEHPWPRMAAEYECIRGCPFATKQRPPIYYGRLAPEHHAGLVALGS